MTKKDIGQITAYTIGRALTVLANWWFIIRTSVHSSIIPKDYSINNLVVNYAENEQIEKLSLRTSKYLGYNAINKIPSDSDPSFNFLVSYMYEQQLYPLNYPANTKYKRIVYLKYKRRKLIYKIIIIFLISFIIFLTDKVYKL